MLNNRMIQTKQAERINQQRSTILDQERKLEDKVRLIKLMDKANGHLATDNAKLTKQVAYLKDLATVYAETLRNEGIEANLEEMLSDMKHL